MENGTNRALKNIVLLAVGGAAGALAALLLAPKTGKELRGDIKRDIDGVLSKARLNSDRLVKGAKETADEVLIKADQIVSLAKNYASGSYEGPFDKLKNEINHLKSGINAAIHRYKESDAVRDSESEIYNQDLRDLESMMEFSYDEDDSLPKQEGMRRRN